jgi:outer membrane protein assembly factor BamB
VVAGDEVMALDATSLDDVWRYKLPVGTKVAIGKEMAISSDFIVVPTNVGTLLRLRRERKLPKVAQEGEEGEKVVSRELSPVRLGANITTGVCGRDKIVFVCTDDSIVHAVNVETGAEIWRYKLEKNVEAMPVTDNERLFVVDSGGTVYAFKVDNGALIWSDRLDSEVLASPVIIGQFIVIVTTEGSVYAYVR